MPSGMLRGVKGLYAIIDVDFLTERRLSPIPYLEAVLSAHPAAVQLRAKSLGARQTLALLRVLSARCASEHVPFFANDRPDLAILASCDGVHLGQTDMDLVDARRLSSELAIGVSTHRLDEVDVALRQRPAYVAFGPVFSTASKPDAEPVVGLEALAEAARRCRVARVPLVAIGGLTLERAPLIAPWADAGAVISALLPSEGLSGVSESAQRLHAALGGARRTTSGGEPSF
jgi:thiamine-phosphate pyrophosphorylase